MCELGKNLQFCTCITEIKVIHNKNSRRNKNLKPGKPTNIFGFCQGFCTVLSL